VSGDADYVRGYSVSGDTVCQVIQCVRGYSVSGDTVSGDTLSGLIQCVRGCRLCQGIQCVR